MKIKKINSIHYGDKVIGIGLVFMVLLPSLLLWMNGIFGYEFLKILAKGAFVIGGLILAVFACLLLIELRQDEKMNQYYSEHRNVKVPLKDGKYECGACGNRNVGADSTCCHICGCRFEK